MGLTDGSNDFVVAIGATCPKVYNVDNNDVIYIQVDECDSVYALPNRGTPTSQVDANKLACGLWFGSCNIDSTMDFSLAIFIQEYEIRVVGGIESWDGSATEYLGETSYRISLFE